MLICVHVHYCTYVQGRRSIALGHKFPLYFCQLKITVSSYILQSKSEKKKNHYTIQRQTLESALKDGPCESKVPGSLLFTRTWISKELCDVQMGMQKLMYVCMLGVLNESAHEHPYTWADTSTYIPYRTHKHTHTERGQHQILLSHGVPISYYPRYLLKATPMWFD